ESICRYIIPNYPKEHPLKPTALRNLGWILYCRYEATGSTTYLNEAVGQQRLALTEMPMSQFNETHQHLRYLGWYLYSQYDSLGNATTLEECISVLAEALEHCPSTHIDRNKLLSDMLWALYRKAIHYGDIKEIDQGI
ncbi:hypothetical protein PUNSTDRAFT_18177, partial [Punctularia strigosozonata HHB-11173 SS5]|uniref:uncharacterized protein n=1 Tax=Punctularia strigosozonata (strain HHB-11173) TaxID=741275 RepID=UPI00044180B0